VTMIGMTLLTNQHHHRRGDQSRMRIIGFECMKMTSPNPQISFGWGVEEVGEPLEGVVRLQG
jgi:hypothetical protein